MKAWNSAKRWTDKSIKWSNGLVVEIAALVLILPSVAILALARFLGLSHALSILIAAPLYLAGFAFFLWRSWRAAKASAIRGDRHFDRLGKYDVSSEYHNTKSATAASSERRQ